MFDDTWDLINGPEAHEIEVLNHGIQANVIEGFVRLLLHRSAKHGESTCPAERALLEMHRAGTLFLLARPGEYRVTNVHLANAAGVVAYTPPDHSQVVGLMALLFAELFEKWDKYSALEAAAFCLWRINWVHPFKNGNGRSARAMAYACLCLKYGFMLPGAPIVIDQILTTKPRLEAGLRFADSAFADTGEPDLSYLVNYLEDLLVIQLGSVSTGVAGSP